ncbi:MAG: hypothetical protein V2G33_06740 [bacterium JZ-2024 1]
MKAKWVVFLSVLISALAFALLIWLNTRHISRILQEGDRFVFRGSNGKYEITVTKKDLAHRLLTLKGRNIGGFSFYQFTSTFSYRKRFLELLEFTASGAEVVDCMASQEGNKFLTFPLKRWASKSKEYSFRLACSEGDFLFMDHMKQEKPLRLSTPAGEFSVLVIHHTITYPFQEEIQGTGTFFFAPSLGFPVKIEITIEGVSYPLLLENFHLSSP